MDFLAIPCIIVRHAATLRLKIALQKRLQHSLRVFLNEPVFLSKCRIFSCFLFEHVCRQTAVRGTRDILPCIRQDKQASLRLQSRQRQTLGEFRAFLIRRQHERINDTISAALINFCLKILLREKRVPRKKANREIACHFKLIIVLCRIKIDVGSNLIQHIQKRSFCLDALRPVVTFSPHIDAGSILDGEDTRSRILVKKECFIYQFMKCMKHRSWLTRASKDKDIRCWEQLTPLRCHFEKRYGLQQLA